MVKALESFIKSSEHSFILQEFQNSNQLKDSSRRALVAIASNFLRANCGNYPTKEQKIACASSIIQLFPCYRIPNSKFNGIVSFSQVALPIQIQFVNGHFIILIPIGFILQP